MDIRRRLFEFEDTLETDFVTPFRSIAIPDEMDPNLPRFESQSVHKHSKIQVSQTRITLATSYNENFKSDFEEVRNYITTKCDKLIKLANKEDLEFIAYIIELGIHMKESEINSFIKKNTGAHAVGEDCRDFSLLYSKEYQNDYYLNINCSKFSENELILHKESGTLRPTDKVKHGISVILDINTKPHMKKNNEFNQSLYKKLEENTFKLINSKNVIDFLKGNI